MMKKDVLGLTAALAVTLLAAKAPAVTYGGYALEGVVGSGTNTSICVLDFGANDYAFGYRWDGTSAPVLRPASSQDLKVGGIPVYATTAAANTGEAMLLALADPGNGLGFSATIDYPVWGPSASFISYAGNTMTTDFYTDPYPYISYWVSGGYSNSGKRYDYAGGGAGGPTWTWSQDGIMYRFLADGSWDGQVAAVFSPVDTDHAPDGAFASVPAPEPGALSLLALGSLALLKRRRNG